MKKKMFSVFMIISLALLFSVGTSFAEDWYYNVNLVKSTVADTGVIIIATNDSDVVVVQQYLYSGIEKTGLAVALTAQSLGRKVHLCSDGGEIVRIVLSTETL